MKPMQGQQTLFDLPTGEKRKPCEYYFQRFIGQVVQDRNGRVGKITKIGPYYTEFEVLGEPFVGTPTTISPVSCFDCIQFVIKNDGTKKCGCMWAPKGYGPLKNLDACVYWEARPNEDQTRI